jgi:hypothetical protein
LLRQERFAKEGDRASLPCGYPPVHGKKWENPKLACGSNIGFSNPFSATHKRQLRSGIHVKNNGEIAWDSWALHFTGCNPYQIIRGATNS